MRTAPSPGLQCQWHQETVQPPCPQPGAWLVRLGQVRTCNSKDLLIGLEGQQRLGQLSQEGLQDHGRDVDVPIVIEVHRLAWTQSIVPLSSDLGLGIPASKWALMQNGSKPPKGKTLRLEPHVQGTTLSSPGNGSAVTPPSLLLQGAWRRLGRASEFSAAWLGLASDARALRSGLWLSLSACAAHRAEKGRSCHLMSGNDQSACSRGETSLSVSCFTNVTGVLSSDAMSPYLQVTQGS